MTSKKQAKANAGVLRCTQDDKRKTGTGISRGLKPVSSAGGDWIAQAKAWAYLRNNDKDKTRG